MSNLRFSKLKPHPILFDEEQTGAFASELRTLAAQEQVPPWCTYIGWLEDSPVVMGGYKGAPGEENSVEIGYLTFEEHQGKGHATALAAFLIQLAEEHGVRAVTAHTSMEVNASTRVLEKTGFVRNGIGYDEDVGAVWRWHRVSSAATPRN
ncbi:GNAT family N-acetyltransferase [Sphingomonas mesophila]|uniref:GNAT family N-acetyltransferase n=1 Tax=Sphingomonas mesophila TaxID=2303576 RepID=UPI000E57A2D8|nr:GNAT family N-acetyltransferase [Sphingomonas mesophila]